MDISANFGFSYTEQDSHELDILANILETECDLTVQKQKSLPRKGVKDAGLTVALAIIGFGLSGISTLISALTFWKSTRPKYSVSVKVGDLTFNLENPSTDEIQDLITQEQKPELLTKTEIVIYSNDKE